MSVALENARLFDETQRLFKETEQRAAELAIINSVQEGLAAELDFQAIVDLVGDKIREMFAPSDMSHRVVRPASSRITMPYYLRARRALPSRRRLALGKGVTGHVLGTRQPLVINKDFLQRAAELGSTLIGDAAVTDRAKATWVSRSSRATRRSA